MKFPSTGVAATVVGSDADGPGISPSQTCSAQIGTHLPRRVAMQMAGRESGVATLFHRHMAAFYLDAAQRVAVEKVRNAYVRRPSGVAR